MGPTMDTSDEGYEAGFNFNCGDSYKECLLLWWLLMTWLARNVLLIIGILTVTFYLVFGPFTVRVIRRPEPREYEL
jgi:hypothetical protein